MLIFGIFWIWSSFSVDSWSSGLQRANLSPHSTAQIKGSIYVAIKHFLQHSYNFQHILCTYYLSLWANANFSPRKLPDFEIETEVTIRIGTDVHCGLQYCCKHTEKADWNAAGFLACKVALIFLFRAKHTKTCTPGFCILDRLDRALFKGGQKTTSCSLWVLRDVGQLCWLGVHC